MTTTPQEDEDLRNILNSLFDDGRIAHANDKSPAVCEAYIDRAEALIKARDEQRELDLLKEIASDNWQKSIPEQYILDRIKRPKSDLVRPKKHINRGDGFTHADNDGCACFTLYSKEDTL